MTPAIWVLVPLAAMALTFGLIWTVSNYFTEKMRTRANPDGAYRALAEEAVRSQKELLEETRRMTASLREVERLLREV